MHDDVFVYNPGIVNSYFSLAEQGKVVAPLHKSYNNMEAVEKAMREKYGQAVCFFPYFLFIKRENLNKTRIDFGSSKECELEGIKFSGDYGIKLVLDLLEAGAEFEMLAPANSLENLPQAPDWVHAQGLSYDFFSKGINPDENKLAWAMAMLNIDPLKVACMARKYKSYEN